MPGIASFVCSTLVIPVLVTAMHVAVVQDLAEGHKPSIGRSAATALRVAIPVGVVVALYFLAVAVGFVLLVVPGIWLSVSLYFGAQAVVVDGARGVRALRLSGRYVEGEWWPAFGTLLMIGLLSSLIGGAIGLITGGLVNLVTDVSVLIAAWEVIGSAASVSLTALLATIYFFGLRAATTSPRGADRLRRGPEDLGAQRL